MSGHARLDVPIGIVPDYSTFVRHVWRYEDPDMGRVVGRPPWMYSILFEDRDEVNVVLQMIEALVKRGRLQAQHIEVVTQAGADGAVVAYEIRFANMTTLHGFLVTLGNQSAVDVTARQIGEFLMWTLGFRWV